MANMTSSVSASQVAGELAENATQTKSVIEKFFDTFSFAKLVSAAILLVICIICIKIILRATEKMLKSSKLDKSCHAFLRSSIKIVLVFLAIMLLAGISLIVDGVFDLIVTFAFSKRIRTAREKLRMYANGPIIDSGKVDD